MEQLTDKQKNELMKLYQLSECKTAQDKQQTILSEFGILPNPYKFAKLFFKDKVKDKSLICPFCLRIQQLKDFTYAKGFYLCSCGNQMTEKTLSYMFDIFNVETVKTELFAQWVYNYRLNGFFSKICLDIEEITKDNRFQEWNNRLHNFGISYDFWENYKRLKGESAKKELY